MPDLTRYAEAARWCERSTHPALYLPGQGWPLSSAQEKQNAEWQHDAACAAHALACVRAMEALASGRVRLVRLGGVGWDARVTGVSGNWHTAPDPLDAISNALDAEGKDA